MMFRNEYAFLSNFHPVKIRKGRVVFPSVENAFQAMKTENVREWEAFTKCSPAQAKKLGRKVKLRSDWDNVKLDLMEKLVRAKFELPHLKEKLLNVEGEIVEDNYWKDTFWGVCNGVGRNELGKILMKVREELKE